MQATIFAFPQPKKGPQPWTNDELAELYRVVDMLARAGLAVETDMGMSDDGDPWFVFCRTDTGDVIAHFARIDGQFVAASVAVDETYRGANFRQIVDQMVRSQPLILPPVSSSTRLLLHPMVVLTAFVATALAFSDKAMAADLLRPVEAKWDHQPGGDDSAASADHGAAKAGKPGWFDSLQHAFRAHQGDSRANAEADTSLSGNAQGISLASLVAIAMASMQPVVDKLSFFSETIAGDGPAGDHASAAMAHGDAFAAAADLPLVETAATQADGAIVVRPDAQSDGLPVKKDAPDLASADAQKIALDSHTAAPSHDLAAAASPVKAPVADDAMHRPVGDPGEGYVAAVILQQKVAATSADTTTSHSDVTKVDPTVITIKDISTEALQVLKIHIDPNAPSGVGKSGTGTGTGTGTSHDGGTDTGGQAAPQLPAVQHVSTNDGTLVLNTITDFVQSGNYDLTGPLSASSNLLAALAPFADANHQVKVIVFDSNSVNDPLFKFVQGVVFVDEHTYFAGQAVSDTTSGSHVVLDQDDGGSVTLVGVVTYHLPG